MAFFIGKTNDVFNEFRRQDIYQSRCGHIKHSEGDNPAFVFLFLLSA